MPDDGPELSIPSHDWRGDLSHLGGPLGDPGAFSGPIASEHDQQRGEGHREQG